MENTKKAKNCGLLVFCAVLLFNPNLNVIDLLPDFIAWFILARYFERAADSAPYFEEARDSFVRLGWLSLIKIPALFLILFVKSKDTLDNNIFALVSFSFAIFETILLIQCVKNLYAGLFHLGERTDAASLIKSFNGTNRGFIKSPEELKNFTYLFFIMKTALYVLPDLFMLTSVTDKGTVVSGSPLYPYVLIISMSAVLAVGILWLIKTSSYVKLIHSEGKFESALCAIASEKENFSVEKKAKQRSILFALTMLLVTTFFSIEIKYDNWNGINILPHFIYGSALILVYCKISKHTRSNLFIPLSGALFSLSSLAAYISSILFLAKYEYKDLISNTAAKKAYATLCFLSAAEFVFLTLFLVLFALGFNKFIEDNTGLSPSDEHYQKLDSEFHRSLKTRNFIMLGLGIFAGAAKCANVILNSEVQILFTETSTVTASILPWFGTVVTISSVAYIAFSFFFISTLKDEVKMKLS